MIGVLKNSLFGSFFWKEWGGRETELFRLNVTQICQIRAQNITLPLNNQPQALPK